MRDCKNQRAKLLNSLSVPDATMLEKMCTNHTAKVTTLRSTTIPKITVEFLNAADKSIVKEQHNLILKRKIATNKKTQTAIIHALIFQTKQIESEAQKIYKKVTQSPKKYHFKPRKINKPQN